MSGFVLFGILTALIVFAVLYIVLSVKNAKKKNAENWIMKFWAKPKVKVVSASLISILCGLIFGCIMLIVFVFTLKSSAKDSFKNLINGIQLIFAGPFGLEKNPNGFINFGWSGVYIGNVLFNAMPLILYGLSVAFAFKTGLFNIGTPGQYLAGTATTLILALVIPTSVVPPVLVWIIAFLGGILAGAIWGVVPGFFKSVLNINEVITCIMMNWIAANVVTALFDKNTGPFKFLLDPSGTKNYAYVYKTTFNGVQTAKLGLDKIFQGSQINAGILVSIGIAILIYVLLNKTTFGFELKACGSNRHAAKYAGINEKRNIILSMAIAGGLAGAGAALYFLSGNTEFRWEAYQALPGTPFNGIPVALLATNNPLGVIFSALFMSYLDVAGMRIKYLTSYNEYITQIISAVIVYFSAFSYVIIELLNRKKKKRIEEHIEETKPKEVVTEEIKTEEVQNNEKEVSA